MEIRDLAYFETIAETEHLGHAAERLGRTQPALTKCIRRLEDSIGSKLFSRAGRGLKLTPVGEALLCRARRLRSSMDEALREVTDFAQGVAGHVRIGAGATMAEYLLPRVCGALTTGTPKVTIEILIAMNDVLRDSLRAGEIDVLVGPVLAGEGREFAIEVFGSDEVVVVAPVGHPLCGRKVTMENLARYRWVLPAKSVAMRRWLDRVFEANGLLGPRVQIETNSILMLPRLIAETALLSFTSTRNLGRGRVGAHLERLDIDTTTMRRHLGLVHRKDGYLSPAAMRFVRLVTEMGEALLTPAGSRSRFTNLKHRSARIPQTFDCGSKCCARVCQRLTHSVKVSHNYSSFRYPGEKWIAPLGSICPASEPVWARLRLWTQLPNGRFRD